MLSKERLNQLIQIRRDGEMLPDFMVFAVQMDIPQAGVARKFGMKN